MRAPAFWHMSPDKPNWRRTLLSPLGALYAVGTARRVAKSVQGYRATCPVICIGNINAGGTGKTPTTIALAQWFVENGQTPIVVSRGYGGRLSGPLWVNPERHMAEDVGDEPILLSAFADVVVSRERADGVRFAQDRADIIILDDGHQNPSVQKDLSFLVVDAAIGFGNGAVIPAGPLREPIDAGLARANALISVGDEAQQHRFSERWASRVTIPRLKARLVPLQTGMSWRGLRTLAFAGIGHPERFFATLRALGADVVSTVSLGDHQRFSPQLLARLSTEARSLNAQLVTTEKDAARLPPSFRRSVLTVPVRMEFEDRKTLDGILDVVLKLAKA